MTVSFLGLLEKVQGNTQVPVPECTIKGWVRAPDLAPSTIVQGDARVKISLGCPTVETVVLGLRLKERSLVKALRSKERKPRSRMPPWSPAPNSESSSPWDWPPSVRYANDSDEIAFRETILNEDLWTVREEETVVFETLQHVPLVNGAAKGHDAIQDFAVLVPSTNFPPALDYSNTGPVLGRNQIEITDAEFMYEYFFRALFRNGTTAEISAGITSFQPLHNPAEPRSKLISKDAEANLKRTSDPFNPEEEFLSTNYTVQITGISEAAFTLGSDLQVTAIVTRTGPARIFTLPLKIYSCVEPETLSKWAVDYDPEGTSDWMSRRPRRILRFTPQHTDQKILPVPGQGPQCIFNRGNAVPIVIPSSTEDEVRLQDIVTTRSEPVTIPITVDHRHIPNFETHYQILTSSLEIVIETPRTKGEYIDPDDPSMRPRKNGNGPAFEDDEEQWVPWKKQGKSPMPPIWHTYSGSIPVAVRPTEAVVPSEDCLHVSVASDTKDQEAISEETGCVRPRLIHYLDKDARGPIFIDPSALSEVLAEDPTERERRAPILQPTISPLPKGEELVYRYYAPLRAARLVYVGETWVRKVLSTTTDNEIHINVKGPNELKIQISISPDKTVLDLKRAIAEKSDVEADRQRLLYSGRVIKDEYQLSVYKIQSSHTIHMVKSAARSAPSSGSSSATPPLQLPVMQAGKNPPDPLNLFSHMGRGDPASFNPFAKMGVNPNDPNLQNIMQSPEFLQQMSSLMSNPTILDQILAHNLQIVPTQPQIRQLFQSEQFRNMVSNPETLRTMMQMSAMLRGNGFGGGATSTSTSSIPNVSSLVTPASDTGTGTNPAAPVAGGMPALDPALLQALLGAGPLGGGVGGDIGGIGGIGGGFGPSGAAPAAPPADTRPPEERLQAQLQQLQDMGFTDAAQNVRALLVTGGNVHAAIEYILSGGGI